MALDLIFTPTVTVAGSVIPDFKLFQTDHHLGIAEKSFQIELDRPMEVTTDDTASISFSIGGANYPIIQNKKIEITDLSAWSSSIRGEGSLISRLAPFRTIVFVNQTWLKSVYPNYYLKTQPNTKMGYLIFAKNPGNNPIQFQGVSSDRLFIPELPGKDVRDIDFECILISNITYSYIAQYIAQKIGYKVVCHFRETYVQKTFVVEAALPYFNVFDKLYGNYNPMMWMDDDKKIVYIMDVGGDAQQMAKGTGVVSLSEDSFSVLKYNVTDTSQVVDHLILTGPSRAWTYQTSQSLLRYKKSRVTLLGRRLTLIDEADLETDMLLSASDAAELLSNEGVTVNTDNVFEFSDPWGERNGRQVKTVNMVINDFTGESATLNETIETYNISGTLVHKTYTDYYWADYSIALGHVTKEWELVGKLEGGTTDKGVKSGGIVYKYTTPSEMELMLKSMIILTIGNFIGDTGLYECDVEEYNLVSWYLDTDTITISAQDQDVSVRRYPQIIHRKAMIGNIPDTWATNDDTSGATGYRLDMMRTRREQVRFDTNSRVILRKIRIVEEFLPVFSRHRYAEDVPIKRPFTTQMVPYRWEYFKMGADNQPDATSSGGIITYTGGNMPIGNFHPVLNVYFPDLIDGNRALLIARRIFAKRIRRNTTATIRLTAPVPALTLGMVVQLPSCTKEIFDWNAESYTTITIPGIYVWITGIRYLCHFSGDVNSSTRNGEIYAELDLKKNF